MAEEMKQSSRYVQCLLCGARDGRCRSGLIGNRPIFECFYMGHKRLSVKINLFSDWRGPISDLMGYLINEAPEGTTVIKVANSDIPNSITIEDIRPNIPNMAKKLDILLRWLSETYDVFSTQHLTDVTPYSVYCEDPFVLLNRLKALQSLGFLKIEELNEEIGKAWGHLTPSGVFRVEELKTSNKNSKKAFIAMGFNTKYTKTIKNAVKRGCAKAGIIAETVDESNYVGDINDRIISEINQSKYVIADYTENNYGAYYESGYARGKGIVVIETCNSDWFSEKDKTGKRANRLHFDVEHRNMIMWTDEEDLATRICDRIGSISNSTTQ
jgi:nucleoside 2-deoxyribosyltransferase